MKVDINKKYKTKSGNEVVIHTVNGKDKNYPVVGEVNNYNRWHIKKWSANGSYFFGENDALSDLVEVNEKEVTVYFWESSEGRLFATMHEPCFHGQVSKKTFKLIDGKII